MSCLHQLRSFAFIFGGPIMRSNSITAKYEQLLVHLVPSDIVERVKANVLHRETTAEVEAWQDNRSDEERYQAECQAGLEAMAWSKQGS